MNANLLTQKFQIRGKKVEIGSYNIHSNNTEFANGIMGFRETSNEGPILALTSSFREGKTNDCHPKAVVGIMNKGQ